MANSRNVSFSLNTLGPWSDPLLAGIGGSAASVGMLDSLESAIPTIQNNPGAFDPYHLLLAPNAQEPQRTTSIVNNPIVNTATLGATGDKSIVDAAIDTATIGATDSNIAKTIESIFGINSSITANYNSIVKYSLLAIVGLILIVFGLWIILSPGAKFIIKEGAKAA